MPSQPNKPYRNLLELLEFTGPYETDEFTRCFNSADANGVTYAKTINDKQGYSMDGRHYEAYPLQFAIERRLFHRVQFLFENKATNKIRGYHAFAKLVSLNAPLELLRYCMENNKCDHDEQYPALFSAYAQADAPLAKFEAIHGYCFGLSFEAILLEKKTTPHGAS